MVHKYVLIANGMKGKTNKYWYNYRSIKGIELGICKSGFSVTVSTTATYDINDIAENKVNVFSDAIKKAMLMYLITFSNALVVTSVSIFVDDQLCEKHCFVKDNPLVFSLIDSKLERSISSDFLQTDSVKSILANTKSKNDRRVVALQSYIFSKTKKMETERFIYLWSSFNAIYGWISKYVAKANGYDKNYSQDFKQIIAFQQYLNIGEETIRYNVDKKRIAKTVMFILNNSDFTIKSKGDLDNSDIPNRILQLFVNTENNANKKYDITPYGYLLTQLTYYLRCELFHGSNPIILFAYEKDIELKVLSIVNDLLEEFIESYLPKFLNDEYVLNEVIPKTKNIKLKK